MLQTKRKYERRPSDIPGIIYHPGIGDIICRIRDYCAGGMLVNLTVSDARLRSEEQISISTVCSVHGRKHHLRIQAKIAHIREDQLGVAFIHELDNSSLEMLNTQQASSKAPAPAPATPEPHSAVSEETRTQLIAEIERTFLNTLKPLFDFHVKQLEKALNIALQLTYGSRNRQVTETALIGLGKNGSTVTEQALHKLQQGLQAAARGQQVCFAPASAAGPKLGLVDEGAFEQWLAVSSTATRAEESFEDLLDPVRAGLGYLYGVELSRTELPVGPAAICQAYYDVARQFLENAEVNEFVLSRLEKSVINRLGKFYAELVRLLESRNLIQAARQHAKAENTPVRRTRPQPAPGQPAGQPGAYQGSVSQQASGSTMPNEAASTANGLHFGTLGSLLSSLQQLRTPDRTRQERTGVSISDAALLNLTRKAQSQILSNEAPLHETLQQVTAAEGLGQLTDTQLSSAELVSQLFAKISQDRRIPRSVMDTVTSLRLPYLKVLLNEPEMLSNDGHVARKLLNNLHTLLARQEEIGPGLQHALEISCERLINKYPEHPDVLDEVNAEISSMLRTEHQAQMRNLERVMATQEGQQKIIETRIWISDQILELRDADGCIPNLVHELLVHFWAARLVNLALQKGTASESVKDGLAAVRKLCSLLCEQKRIEQPSPDNLGGYREIHDKLEKELRDTFTYDSVATELLLRLEAIIEEGQPASEDVSSVPVVHLFPNEDLARNSLDLANNLNNPWVRKIRRMCAGQGVVLRDDHGEQKLAALAWHAKDWSRLVFVNNKGMHVRDVYLSQMVEGLRDGQWGFDTRRETNSVDSAILDVMQDVSGGLSIQARLDELTGLINRKSLHSILERHVRRAHAQQATCGYLVINIDQFRDLNLDHGHDAGDRVLQCVASCLEKTLPPDTVIARIGPDEFVVLLPGAAREQLASSAHAICNNIAELHRVHSDIPAATASIGIVIIDEHYSSMDEVLSQGESAILHCKKAGGNRHTFYSAIVQEAEKRQHEGRSWTRIINDVIENERMTLSHQPIQAIQAIQAGDPHRHSELLLAVTDENGQRLPTFDFIVAAENCGRIQEIDRWVLCNALTWMDECEDALKELGGVAINLSADSLGDEQFLEFVVASIRLSRVDPRLICFELTETATVQCMTRLRDFMDGIKTLGCRFALDDFGSGMASYSYLKKLPVDYLKIDGVFIRDLKDNPADVALVRSIADFSRFMGIRTVAEFVEDAETMALLREIGIDYAQGYHVGRPGPLPR